MTDAHQVVAGYLTAVEARDGVALGVLLADHVVYESPPSGERVGGRAAYLRFNAEGFPGEWHLTVQSIVGEDRRAASWVQFTDEHGTQPGLCFFDIDDDG